MQRTMFLRRELGASILCLGFAIGAHAQTITSTSYYVSASTGSDQNACHSRTTPCRTISHALSLAGGGGSIVIVDSGEYDQVTVTKSATIEAAAGVFAQISLTQGNGITVSAGAGDAVTVRGLSFNGSSDVVNAIQVNSVGTLHAENLTMRNFVGSGIYAPGSAAAIDLEHVKIRDCAHGIYSSAPSDWTLNDVTMDGADNAFELESTSGTSRITINHSNLMRGTLGLHMNGAGRATVRDTLISHFTDAGVKVSSGASVVTVESSVFSWNNIGFVTSAGAGLLSNTSFSDNGWAIYNSGATIYSWGNNQTGGQLVGDISGNITPLNRF